MYRNSRLAILLPILLAAAVVLGLLLGRYLGRNTPEAQLRNLVEQLTLSLIHISEPTRP